MSLSRRTLLATVPVLALSACFGAPGSSQAAQDAQLILKATTPIAQSVGNLGVAPATVALVNRSLAAANAAAASLSAETTPGLLDTQDFYVAAQTLLQTLGSISTLPASALATIDAATSLLPTFAAVVGAPAATPRIAPTEARLILQGGVASAPPPPSPIIPPAQPVVAPARPVASAPAGPRFHVSANDFAGDVSYEFWDSGKMIEKGVAPNLHILETRFEAFKRQRLQQLP